MSDSYNNSSGKRRQLPRLKPAFPRELDPIKKTLEWGSTQRIRRKHRKFWDRVLGKLRRNEDRRVIKEGLND